MIIDLSNAGPHGLDSPEVARTFLSLALPEAEAKGMRQRNGSITFEPKGGK